MNRIRSAAIALVMLLSFAALAQQTQMPSVDDHLAWLTTQLNLTADQQTKLRPIVQKMQDNMQKVNNDQTLSDDARHQKMQAVHSEAIKAARPYLTAEQQQKLDELAKNPHPVEHSDSH